MAVFVTISAAIATTLVIALAASATTSGESLPAPRSVRIGVYDSRAVAVAYVRSDISAGKVRDLLEQRAAAEKAGDAQRVKELEAQGERLQRRRHLQGFSTAPIDDILDTVRDRLPALGQDAGVVAIARAADWNDPSVELVDVTDELVALFNPDKQTLRMVADVRTRKPETIESIAAMPAKR